MDNWKINIRKAENGYIIEYPDTLDDGTEVTVEEVIEDVYYTEDYERFKALDSEKITLGLLLERVAEYFGDTYNRYGKENLNISFNKKGHKLGDE